MKDKFTLEKRHEWVFRGNDFSVLVNCHGTENHWTWTLYVLLPGNHKLYGISEDQVMGLPLHGGCTYDRVISETNNMAWSEKSGEPISYRKIGCDYDHWGDEYYRQSDPKLGIPHSVLIDAERLYSYIKERNKC